MPMTAPVREQIIASATAAIAQMTASEGTPLWLSFAGIRPSPLIDPTPLIHPAASEHPDEGLGGKNSGSGEEGQR